jgi:hypothetical protein
MTVRTLRSSTAALLLLLAACPAPGEGPKAARGRERAAPVIQALQRYREAHGAYPDSLAILVPDFLPDSALRTPIAEQESYPLEYSREPSGYVLTFRYVGPGMNYCRYRPERPRWECGGYF